MAKALTVKAIENLNPGGARREIPDGLIAGLYLCVQPTGHMAWAVRYRHHGRPRKLTIGAYPGIGLKDARELASRALVAVASGGDPAADKQAAKAAARPGDDRDLVEKVVAQFVERYAKAHQRPRTAYETERVLNREVVARWRGRRLSDLGKADIHELLDEIVDRGSPIQANRALAAMRRMCGWAIERGLTDKSPCDGVRAPAAERSRDRVLSDDELKAVWKASDVIGWPFGALVRLLILAGQRRSEIAEMRWREIDFDAKVWTLPRERSKNGQAHVVPLSDAAVAVLRSLPRVAGKAGYVFSTNGETPVSGFARAKERLNAELPPDMPGWTLHDLRRTFASGCARLGIAVHVVEAALNHRSGTIRGVAAIYNKYSYDAEKRAAMSAWSRHVEANDEPAGNVVPMRGRDERSAG